MIQLGQYNTLTITRFSDHGAYLDGRELGEILMPKAYVNEDMRAGDEERVFVYLDQQERLVATKEEPYAVVGQFAFLEVAWVNEYGAFLDWGLMKNLFVPFREQKMKMEKGKRYVVYIYIDEETKRIAGTAKVDRFLKPASEDDYHKGEMVDMLVRQKTPLGFKVIVNQAHEGMIYDNQIYEEPKTGDRLEGVIVKVREDGKLDLSVQKIGTGRFQDFAETLLKHLEDAGGELPFSDKSSAEEIVRNFGVSKKTFKRSLGTLYKSRKIILETSKIRLKREKEK